MAAKTRITVSKARRKHILDGDKTGGGHGPGRKVSGKSEFPATLSDDEIIDGIEVIANDPKSYIGGTIPTGGPFVAAGGTIKGVSTRVIIDPAQSRVITAYPLGIKPNP
jgi:hypothetical protein